MQHDTTTTGMRFRAIAHRLPSCQVTNDEVLARLREGSARHLSADELTRLEQLTRACFASTRTRVRYHRAPGEAACDLAVDAGRRALAAAGADPGEIDLLIYVGIGRGIAEPASATIYQDLLKLRRATAFDVMDACASWVRALHIARQFLQTGTYRNIMILNAEFAGRDCHRYELTSVDEFAHWHPSMTIGEAATATIVSWDGGCDEFGATFRTWGAKRDLCFVPLANFDGYFGKPTPPGLAIVPMQFVSFGLRLMEFGATKVIEHYRDSPEFQRFAPDIVFGHSASDQMSMHVLEECGIDPARFQFLHQVFANTVSASVPLGMSHALETGALADGARVLVLTASAGVTTALTKFVFHQHRPEGHATGDPTGDSEAA
jgi:3-oxoacyl-[acyl-carrier-protein] synthase III